MAFHIVPTNDLRPHATDGKPCWCNPEIDDDLVVTLYIHNRLDGREAYERGERKPM